MDPISKPSIDKIIENVKTVLRSGIYTVYDIVQQCANGVNHCIDWVNTNGSAMVDAENARRTAETARATAETARGTAETARATAETARGTAETSRVSAEETRETWFDSNKDKIVGMIMQQQGTASEGLALQFYTVENGAPKTLVYQTSLPLATSSSKGVMSAADKTKLEGIESGAQVNPGVATASSNGLMSSSDKSKVDFAPTQIIPVRTSEKWDFGFVRQIGQQMLTSYTISLLKATQYNAGLMSADDKTKLDGIKKITGTSQEQDDGQLLYLEIDGGTEDDFTWKIPVQDGTWGCGLMSADDKSKLDGISIPTDDISLTITNGLILDMSSGTSRNFNCLVSAGCHIIAKCLKSDGSIDTTMEAGVYLKAGTTNVCSMSFSEGWAHATVESGNAARTFKLVVDSTASKPAKVQFFIR